ncbi:MAG: hypothetical protein R2746_12315 [Acidimicrobiales bacterium]
MVSSIGNSPATTPVRAATLTEHSGDGVREADLRLYQASNQRFGAAVLLAFFCVHFACAHASLRRARAAGSTGTTF